MVSLSPYPSAQENRHTTLKIPQGNIALGEDAGSGVLIVCFIFVREEDRRKGYGTTLYQMAYDLAEEWGLLLVSGTSRTKEAQGFWDKQHAAGIADIDDFGMDTTQDHAFQRYRLHERP